MAWKFTGRQSVDNCDDANLKVSVFLLFTLSNGSRFQIGMVRGMKLFLYGSFFARIRME